MVGSAIALSLIGLGAVQALPAAVEQRQGTWIGDGTGIFIPGQGELPLCLTDVSLNQQPPCILPPIVGGLHPSEKREAESALKRRQVWIGPGPGIITPGQGELPPCLTDTPLKNQPPCFLPPIVGGLNPSDKREAAESHQATKRFTLPSDYLSNTKDVIKRLERELVALQNKKNKTKEDLKEIKALKAALLYLAGITDISAPPGTGTIFIPGKRDVTKRFTLPSNYLSNTKEVIRELERELVALQNKKNKTKEDLKEIKAIKAALLYLAGITDISAPPGTGTVFIPGKRDITLGTVGAYAAQCPNLEGAELALETLMHKDKHTVEERIIMQKLAAFLKGCGITIVSSPDGTWTIIKPSDKRDAAIQQLDVAGLQAAYSALLAANPRPSFANWLALQQIASLLEIYGAPVPGTTLTVTPKRQLTVGTKACQLADVMGLRAALAALLTAYGNPATAPPSIFLVEQVIVTALQICGQSVGGWTTLVPGNPIPGGPIIPDNTIPGGPMIPDKTIPGGPIIPDDTVPGGVIKPSDRRARQAPVGDPAALLAALTVLETAYGGYGSGTIPVPVWLIMVNVVTILQTFPGVVVPGWPVLGQGSVVIGPST